jgi:hypothetical protein
MTLFAKNASLVNDTIAEVRHAVPGFEPGDLHLNIGHESSHYFGNAGYLDSDDTRAVAAAVAAHRAERGHRLHPVRFLEDRYQALVADYYSGGASPLPCTALASSCFIDPYWQLFPCSIWDRPLGTLREWQFDLDALWRSAAVRAARTAVAAGDCPHCWTPCEAYPTILGNLIAAARPRPRSGLIADVQRSPSRDALG